MHGYTYSAANSSANTNSNMPSSWSNGTYSASQQQQPHNPQPQQPLPQSPYGRQPMYGQPNMNFAPRTSQSPATGPEGIAAPPFDQVPQHYSHEAAHMSAPPQHSGILATHGASQPPPASSLAAHSDAYAHTRPGSDPSYYTTSAPPQFSSYPPQHSPQTSPTTGSPGARLPNNSMSGYRPPHYPSYGQLPTMGGTVMSNMHQPGSQMSMMPGMAQGYNGHMVYGHHAQPPPQSERPFKCDQCVQSFSRNHDLKRHKRIHLSVKPFPCNFCSKSFSRKDALKVCAFPLSQLPLAQVTTGFYTRHLEASVQASSLDLVSAARVPSRAEHATCTPHSQTQS